MCDVMKLFHAAPRFPLLLQLSSLSVPRRSTSLILLAHWAMACLKNSYFTSVHHAIVF